MVEVAVRGQAPLAARLGYDVGSENECGAQMRSEKRS